MSSSRRSSRSTRSRIPPVWRPVSASNKVPPPSISFVVAEPEQGAPLASAASQLPASASDDVPTIRGRPLRKESSSSTSMASPTSDSSLDDNQSTISMPANSQHLHPEHHDILRASTLPIQPIHSVPHSPQFSGVTKDIPRSPSSWFGSISRAKGKQKATELKDPFLVAQVSPANSLPTPPASGDVIDSTPSLKVPDSAQVSFPDAVESRTEGSRTNSMHLLAASSSTPQLSSTLHPELHPSTLDVSQDSASTLPTAAASSAPTSPIPPELAPPAHKRASWFGFARAKSSAPTDSSNKSGTLTNANERVPITNATAPVEVTTELVTSTDSQPELHHPREEGFLSSSASDSLPPSTAPSTHPPPSVPTPGLPTPPARGSWFVALTRPKSPSPVAANPNTEDAQLRPPNILSAPEAQPDLPRVSVSESAPGIIATAAEASVSTATNGEPTSFPVPPVVQFIPSTPIDGPQMSASAEALLAHALAPVQRSPPQPIAEPTKKKSWFSPRSSPTVSSPLSSPKAQGSVGSAVLANPSAAAHVGVSLRRSDTRPEKQRHLSHASVSSIYSIDQDTPVPSSDPGTPPMISPPEVVSKDSVISGELGVDPGDGKGTGQATVRRRVSSLNPSTSRFSLSLPLLGRSKTPLETAILAADSAVNHAAGVDQVTASTSEQIQTTTTTSSDTTVRTVATQVATVSSTQNAVSTHDTRSAPSSQIQAPAASSQNASATRTSKTDAKADGLVDDPTATSSTWWDYLGWTSANKPDAPEDAPQDPQDPGSAHALGATPGPGNTSTPVDPATASAPASTSETTSAPPTAHTHDAGQENGHASANPGPDAATVARGVPERAPSIRSAQSQASSAWYTPWSWYTAAAAVTVTAGSVTSEDGNDISADKGMTESERVKEEALARPETAPREVVVPTPQREETNPIEDTISANRSGWASFFSSKALTVKRIEAKKEEQGMEVMDIDDEESVEAKPLPPAAPPTPPDSPDQKVRKGSSDTPKESSKGTSKGSSKPAPPLTISDSVKRETSKSVPSNANPKQRKSASPAPSKRSGTSTPLRTPPPPNLVLPTWQHTFHTAPRNLVPAPPPSTLSRTLKLVSGVLFNTDAGKAKQKGKDRSNGKGKARVMEKEMEEWSKTLPRAWDVLEDSMGSTGRVELEPDVLRGCRRVVVIGIHGWFPSAVMRSVLGEPTGTSGKFVSMMVQALDEFQEQHNVHLEKITKIPLEGEGTIDRRVEKLYSSLLANQEWMDDLHAADAIFVATHSQGSIVSTHVLDRLIRDDHIRTTRSLARIPTMDGVSVPDVSPKLRPQRVCCLALCGIHLGPLRYLSTSSMFQPYIQYFESTAARELFEFQNTENAVSQAYVKALQNVVDHGTKMVYVASLNDQVVPIYSGLFTSASHPLILRALYIDGDAYHSSDFLSNLLVLLLRIMNAGLSESGLLTHLSEATAGSLNGVGHSTAYEELATFSLAVKYLFLTNDGLEDPPPLHVEPFNANTEQNDYEIPWSLRDLIADERVYHLFRREISELRDAFRDWHPKTTVLRDIKKKLQPIQKLPSAASALASGSPSVSKL
ncbi:hypothetical protein HGRIS_007278 [Hohenbuehelia grisea]|uniref:YMC020W-like alpha/beta hydrolase domain-containing protein n=1 Tax=Hohenbuehelia grisea TaxID=104357 RepID=A0ABR3JCC9_9AGAR